MNGKTKSSEFVWVILRAVKDTKDNYLLTDDAEKDFVGKAVREGRGENRDSKEGSVQDWIRDAGVLRRGLREIHRRVRRTVLHTNRARDGDRPWPWDGW